MSAQHVPRRAVRRRALRILLPASLLALAACGGKDGPAGPSAIALQALTTAPRAGEPLTLRVRSGTVAAKAYAGTMNGTAVSFRRVDDSTLFALVPESASGAVRVTATLERASPAITVTVDAARAITDPAAAVTTAIEEARVAAFADTLPTGVDPQIWAADSTRIATGLQQLRSALTSLSARDQLTLARLLVSFRERAATTMSADVSSAPGLDAVAPRGQGAVSGTVVDQPCILAADAWKTAAKVAHDAAMASDASELGVRQALQAYGTLEYLVAYARGAEGAAACRYPTEFRIEDVDLDDQGTTFRVSAVVRSLQEQDRATSLTAQAYDDARNATLGAWNTIVEFVEWAPLSKAKIPEPPPKPREVLDPSFVQLEHDRVIGLTGSAARPNIPAGAANATLSVAGSGLRLDVRERVEDLTTAQVEFVFIPAGVAQRRTLPLPVQRCEEQGRWYRRCSHGVKVDPDEFLHFTVGGKLQLRGRVYAKDLTELPNRRITWSVGTTALALTRTTGDTTTVRAMAPANVAVLRATATDAVIGAPAEEFYRVHAFSINNTLVGATGLGVFPGTQEPNLPVLRDGQPLRFHVYFMQHDTRQPLLLDYTKVGVHVVDPTAQRVTIAVEPDDRGVWVTITKKPNVGEWYNQIKFSYQGQMHSGEGLIFVTDE